MNRAAGFAWYCNTCDCTVHIVMPDKGNVGVPYEYEADRFTVSGIRHICWPRQERIGRLIMARRQAAARSAA